MDTTNFIKNFNPDDIATAVTRYFDEIMVLYRLVGNRQDMDICTTNNESSIATFVLTMNSEDDAEEVYGNLNGTSFSVYGCMYDISMQLLGSSITTTIMKATL